MSLQSQQNHKENYDEEAFKLFQLLNIDITEGFKNSQYDDLNVIYVNPRTGYKVYCGNITAASTLSILQKNGIRYVVNCQDPSSKNYFENTKSDIRYFRFPIAHWHSSSLIKQGKVFEFFKPFFSFVDSATTIGKGNVLIHCLAGAHRAGTSSCSYVLYKTKSNAQSAIKTAKTLRPIIDPIYSLKDLLIMLEGDMRKLKYINDQ